MFEGQIDENDLEKWLTMLEGYISIHIFLDRENITFALLKAVPHFKNWWETYCEKNSTKEFGMFEVEHTWKPFMDVVKEQYYLVGNYDDQYMIWTTLHQERDQTVLEFTNNFHTLRTKLGIIEFKRHLVLK
jgi:Sec7-like guanine-nucleotide exchange factor